MLTLNIASTHVAPSLEPLPGSLQLNSKAFSGPFVISFPPFGRAEPVTIPLNADGPFDLECTVVIGKEFLGFGFTYLFPGDALNVVRHEVTAFTATIFHAAPHSPNVTCTATCADGTKAQGCVVCQSGSLRGKICC